MNRSIFKEFIQYVSLNILGQMAYSCYTLADTFFVSSSLGTIGLTALNLAFPFFCIVNGTGLMIGIGGGAAFSISKNRGKSDAANNIFTHAVYLVTVFSALFFFLGIFFSKIIVTFLGADQSILNITNTYLKTLLLFSPAFLINHLLQCFVRNDGKPSLSMTAMMIGSFSNIILDYIFIFPLNMGIFGAAFATGLSPLISIGILLPYLISKKKNFHFRKSCIHWHLVKNIVTSGVPPFLTEVTSGIVMFLFNFIILRISGNTGVAAFGVITVISLVVVALYTGLSQGIQPLLSRYCGLQQPENIRFIAWQSFISTLLLSFAIYAFIFCNAPFLVHVFNSENNLLLKTLAVNGLKIYFTACPFIGFNIVCATLFISIGKPAPAQIISLLRGFFILIPMAFLCSYLWGMNGVWWACPATELTVAIVSAFLLLFRH